MQSALSVHISGVRGINCTDSEMSHTRLQSYERVFSVEFKVVNIIFVEGVVAVLVHEGRTAREFKVFCNWAY